jgi:3-oxoadipate enol-lactonase
VTMIVTPDGVHLHLVEEGHGAPVILLHGHTLDLRVWEEVVPSLIAAGFRAIRYDQRGHGRSSSPPSGYRYGDHAADLAEVIARLDAAPAHVVGLSRGAGIALELAVRQPALVRSLALIAPLVPDFELSEELFESFRALARAIRGEGVQPAMRAHWLGHPLIASAAAIPGVRERLEAMFNTFPAGEYLASVRDGPDRAWKLTDRLGEIATPALVMTGEHEIPDFAAMAALLAERLPGSVLEIVTDSGHLVPMEQPRAAAEVLVHFLCSLQ